MADDVPVTDLIRTTVDDKKMAALYAAVRANEALINASSHPLALSYMHAAAVLEDPVVAEAYLGKSGASEVR